VHAAAAVHARIRRIGTRTLGILAQDRSRDEEANNDRHLWSEVAVESFRRGKRPD
jgi:hypothetical protein